MIELLDQTATRIEREYRAYLQQLSGIFTQIFDGMAPTVPAARSIYAARAQLSQSMFLSNLGRILDETSLSLENIAVESVNPELSAPQRDNLNTLVHEARNALVTEIALATQKDSETIARQLRQLAFNVDQHMNAKGTTYNVALMNAKIDLGGSTTFFQVDRSGRRWASTNYAKTGSRGFLVKTYIESYLYAMTAAGNDLARVDHPEEDHMHNGVVFSVSGESLGIPTYSEIRDEVWHPNSRALVSKV